MSDISRRNARTGERVIIKALFACAVLSIAVTVGIVAVLLVDTVEFFRDSSLSDFLPHPGQSGRRVRAPVRMVCTESCP
ncbi:MAG TPA: hypothetical protein VFN05_12320 [Actinomycetes bacterium]|nr:hypothetical protein [Actinomycetes bacterium]